MYDNSYYFLLADLKMTKTSLRVLMLNYKSSLPGLMYSRVIELTLLACYFQNSDVELILRIPGAL